MKPAGGLTSCCGIRPKPLKPPTTALAPPTRAARNFIDPEDTELAEEDAEPVYAASRRRPARGDAPGNAASAGAERGGDDDEDDGGADAGGGGRRGSGGGGASFFAPSAAAAGKDHVAVIQGASRGIGLELVRQLLERPDLKARSGARCVAAPRRAPALTRRAPFPAPGGRVVATCRTPASAVELQELLAHYGKERLTILRLDVLDEASIEAAADVVEQRFGRCDLLINASGVLHIPGELQPGARAPLARVGVCARGSRGVARRDCARCADGGLDDVRVPRERHRRARTRCVRITRASSLSGTPPPPQARPWCSRRLRRCCGARLPRMRRAAAAAWRPRWLPTCLRGCPASARTGWGGGTRTAPPKRRSTCSPKAPPWSWARAARPSSACCCTRERWPRTCRGPSTATVRAGTQPSA